MNTNCERTHPATRDVEQTVRRAAVMQIAEIGLAAKRFRAIDLSCRARGACGAGARCWAWISGRGTFGVEPPTSNTYIYINTYVCGSPKHIPLGSPIVDAIRIVI